MIMRIPPSQDYSEEAYCRGISDYMPSMTASGFSFLHRADPESLPTDLMLMTVSPTLEVQWSCPLHLESRAAANSVIATLGRSRPLQLPTDHRFMCFNRDTGLCDPTPITQAMDKMVPRVASIPNFGSSEATSIVGFDGQPCQLTRLLGWWIGCVIGNGWVCNETSVYLSGAIGSEVLSNWSGATERLFLLTTGAPQDRTTATGAWGASRKIRVSSCQLARWLKPMVGHRAEGKHLPQITFSANRDFQLGILEGLFDTDGTLGASSSGRFNVAYTTKSPILGRQIAWLLAHLGVESNFQLKTNNFERKFWGVYPSVVDFQRLSLSFADPARNNVMTLLRQNPPSTTNRNNDIVPLTKSECEIITERFRGTTATKKKGRNNYLFTLYTAVRKAAKLGHIGRISLRQIVAWLGSQCPESVSHRLALNLHWDRVTAIEPVGPMNVLDIHFEDNVAVVGDYGIPAFSQPAASCSRL
jgi:hypothetical protein